MKRPPRFRRYLAPSLLLAALVLILIAFRRVLVPFLIAIIIVYLIEPLVKRLNRIRLAKRIGMPRWAAVVSVYLVFFGVVSVLGLLVVPPLAREVARLASEAPQFLEEVRREHIPALNRELDALIGRWFPSRMDESHVAAARRPVREALEQAETMAVLHGMLTPEERARLARGELDLDLQDTERLGEEIAFRIRHDPITGDYLVVRRDEESFAIIDAGRGIMVVRSGATDDAASRSARTVPQLDLEAQLNASFQNLVERSGEGVAALIGLAQNVVLGLVGMFVAVFLTFMVAAFISIDLPRLMRFLREMFPRSARRTYDDLLAQLDKGLSGVVRGQLLICLANGVITGAGLLLFEVKYALILALFVTVMSIIPLFGSIISTIPCVLIGLTDSVSKALLVLVWILLTSFIEANFLNPKIIGTQAHIHPAIVMFALLAGGSSFGVLGALLAVPVTSILLTLFKFVLARSEEPAALEGEPEEP
jgi:predicted PurR-regulated permease PerM